MLSLGITSVVLFALVLGVCRLTHNAVPIVLIPMPFVLAVCGFGAMVGFLLATGLPGLVAGIGGCLAALVSYKWSDRLANKWFTRSIMSGK